MKIFRVFGEKATTTLSVILWIMYSLSRNPSRFYCLVLCSVDFTELNFCKHSAVLCLCMSSNKICHDLSTYYKIYKHLLAKWILQSTIRDQQHHTMTSSHHYSAWTALACIFLHILHIHFVCPECRCSVHHT